MLLAFVCVFEGRGAFIGWHAVYSIDLQQSAKPISLKFILSGFYRRRVRRMNTPMNKSVVKLFQVLSAFQGVPDGLTLTEIAQRSGVVVPTAHRFLRTLVSLGALEQASQGRYIIGPALRELSVPGSAIKTGEDILHHHVCQLSLTVRETVHVAVLDGDMVNYIAKVENQRSKGIVTLVGTDLEAYCTGVGKVLLAHQPGNFIRHYLRSGAFVALTPTTITEHEDLLRELEKVRQEGYAIDDEEFEVGLRCVAVPISIYGRVVGALSCSGPTSRMTNDLVPKFRAATALRARMIAAEFEQRSLPWVR